MSEDQLTRALEAGRDAIRRAQSMEAQLFIGGEMGIGNTTSATALACILLHEKPERLTGPGTGLSAEGIIHKINVIRTAIELHQDHIDSPLEALRRVGGFEIAALTGAYITCANQGIPSLIDGFISSVAALAAEHICAGTKNWFLYSHHSAEPGHGRVLSALGASTLLDLRMRLGEGSGAAIAVPLLRMACALHNDMATFAEAQVSEKK
jgi:nicotinate-nucleotide--dimethylbenzimidazole phosphoribosyltransferase